jgi:hypothetical protein
VASPPIAIVPLSVVVPEGRISLAAERVTAPVISYSGVASTIIGGVPRPVNREVSIAIDRYVIAITKLIRVSETVNLSVPCAVHRDFSFTIDVDISGPVDRDIPIAIHRNITSRAKLLFPL